MSIQLQLKRDQEGSNKFLKLSKFYQICEEKFENGFEQFEENVLKSQIQTLIKRREDFKNNFRVTDMKLSKLIEQSEKLANILEASKFEDPGYNFNMYFYNSFQILNCFIENTIKNEEIKDYNVKKRVLIQVLNALLLKNYGHSLLYNLFLGWAVYYTQIFQDPNPQQNEEVPLLALSNNSKILYDSRFMYISFTFCALICVNSINLIQFLRESRKEEQQYEQLKGSYKNCINLDIEQQDYYWHFIDTFCQKVKKQTLFNHINIIMLLNFLEMSYIQMKTAADGFPSSSELYKNTLCANKNEYKMLFEFIEKSLLQVLKNHLQLLQNENKIDFIYKNIQIKQTTFPCLQKNIHEIEEKLKSYSNKTLFKNEIISEDDNNQNKIQSHNPYYFLKFF